MSGKDTEEKTLPPTQHKLRKQREKGNVVTSKETITSMVSISALAYLYLRRDALGEKLSALFILEGSDESQGFGVELQSKLSIVSQLAIELVAPLLLLVIAISLITGMIISGGPLFATEPITPKFEKINPAAGFKRIFSRRAMMTFLLHLVRLALLTAVFGFILVGGWSAFIRAPICGLGCAGEAFEAAIQPIVIASVAVMASMALLDYLVQRAQFMREQKMSITEYKREIKDQEGDPQLQGQIRQDRRDMLEAPTGAREAILLLDNSPESVIGIRYVDGETPAPIVVARARGGDGCRRLLSVADAFEAPDNGLAEALAKTPVGSFITEEATLQKLAPLVQRAIMAGYDGQK